MWVEAIVACRFNASRRQRSKPHGTYDVSSVSCGSLNDVPFEEGHDVVDSRLWTLGNKRRNSSKIVAGELGLLSYWAESMWRRKMVGSSRRRRHRRFVRHGSLHAGVLSISSRVGTEAKMRVSKERHFPLISTALSDN